MNQELTNLFKSIIINEGLVDTKALLNSIRVFVKIDYDLVIINIVSKTYLKFLNERYDLTEKFVDDPSFSKELEKIYTPIYETYLQNLINNVPGLREINPRLTLLLNGK